MGGLRRGVVHDKTRNKSYSYFYRPLMKLREGNVLRLCVILFTGGGLCQGHLLDRDPSRTETPRWPETPRTKTPLDRDPFGQRPPLTETPFDRDPLDRGPLAQRPPWTEIPLDRDPSWTETPLYGNERAVRMPLECILVTFIFDKSILYL